MATAQNPATPKIDAGVQPLRAGHVKISLIDRSHLDQRRKTRDHPMNFLRALSIAVGMSINEDSLWA